MEKHQLLNIKHKGCNGRQKFLQVFKLFCLFPLTGTEELSVLSSGLLTSLIIFFFSLVGVVDVLELEE